MKTLSYLYICAIILISAFVLPVNIDAAEMSEYEIKSGMLYNFTLFVEWPAESLAKSRIIDVCVAGDNASTRPFYRLNGKPYKDRTLAVRQIRSPGNATGCNLLFIHNSERSQLPAYLQIAQKESILAVSDIDNFASLGGMIGFFEQNSKIRFEINLDASRQAKIKINSQLLKLARIVTSYK